MQELPREERNAPSQNQDVPSKAHIPVNAMETLAKEFNPLDDNGELHRMHTKRVFPFLVRHTYTF